MEDIDDNYEDNDSEYDTGEMFIDCDTEGASICNNDPLSKPIQLNLCSDL